MKYSIYIKWTIAFVLAIIITLWLSYFFECLYKSQTHHFLESNWALNFINWISTSSNDVLVIHPNLFEDDFYLKDFPGFILFAEVFFIVLLLVAAIIQKQKRKRYITMLVISILCFVGLFEFIDATLKLFVPG